MYKNKNLLFIIVIVLFLSFIGIFNYKFNPYSLFSARDHVVITFDMPSEYIYPYIKIHKKDKCDVLSLGTSESRMLMGTRIHNTHHRIAVSNIEDHIEMLKAYLDIHPELKKVYVGLNLNYFSKGRQITIPPYNSDVVSFTDVYSPLFSFSAIYDYIKNTFFTRHYDYDVHCTYLKNMELSGDSEETLKQKEQSYFNSIKKLISVLDESKVSYDFVILPINVSYLAIIKNDKRFSKVSENLRRFIVQQLPYVYDFALVNNITKQDIKSKDNYVWEDYSHMTEYAGVLYYNILFKQENMDQGLFRILTKDNVDSVISQQNKLIDNFYKNNKQLVKYYDEIAHDIELQDMSQVCYPCDDGQRFDYFHKFIYKNK